VTLRIWGPLPLQKGRAPDHYRATNADARLAPDAVRHTPLPPGTDLERPNDAPRHGLARSPTRSRSASLARLILPQGTALHH